MPTEGDRWTKPVELEENLARFLFSPKEYAATLNKVRPQAFRPNKELKLSMFRVDELETDEIQNIALVCVAPIRKAEPHGWFTLLARFFVEHGLSFDPNNCPERHVNVIGWPGDKDKRKQIYQKLRDVAQLFLLERDQDPNTAP